MITSALAIRVSKPTSMAKDMPYKIICFKILRSSRSFGRAMLLVTRAKITRSLAPTMINVQKRNTHGREKQTYRCDEHCSGNISFIAEDLGQKKKKQKDRNARKKLRYEK